MTIMEMNKIAFSPAKIDNLVIDITKKNISKIRDVEKVIVRGRE
jgi:hypothetical protein